MVDYESISSEIQTYRIGLIHPHTLDNKQEGNSSRVPLSLVLTINFFEKEKNKKASSHEEGFLGLLILHHLPAIFSIATLEMKCHCILIMKNSKR
ncbi:hypothetical protein BFINE_20300 [Bacteroides finegoldii DSM 17565]|nr:hypothetical protein BFINE_20300 [Bacteroides finegoldii DSM 17565]